MSRKSITKTVEGQCSSMIAGLSSLDQCVHASLMACSSKKLGKKGFETYLKWTGKIIEKNTTLTKLMLKEGSFFKEHINDYVDDRIKEKYGWLCDYAVARQKKMAAEQKKLEGMSGDAFIEAAHLFIDQFELTTSRINVCMDLLVKESERQCQRSQSILSSGQSFDQVMRFCSQLIHYSSFMLMPYHNEKDFMMESMGISLGHGRSRADLVSRVNAPIWIPLSDVFQKIARLVSPFLPHPFLSQITSIISSEFMMIHYCISIAVRNSKKESDCLSELQSQVSGLATGRIGDLLSDDRLIKPFSVASCYQFFREQGMTEEQERLHRQRRDRLLSIRLERMMLIPFLIKIMVSVVCLLFSLLSPYSSSLFANIGSAALIMVGGLAFMDRMSREHYKMKYLLSEQFDECSDSQKLSCFCCYHHSDEIMKEMKKIVLNSTIDDADG